MSTVGSKRSNERKLFFILVKHNHPLFLKKWGLRDFTKLGGINVKWRG